MQTLPFIVSSVTLVAVLRISKSFKFVVCNPCQSLPSLTILLLLWFLNMPFVFFYLNKRLFFGFLTFLTLEVILYRDKTSQNIVTDLF